MYYVDTELLESLPDDVQALIKEKGVKRTSAKGRDAMMAEDAAHEAPASDDEAEAEPTGLEHTATPGMGPEKLDDAEVAPKAVRYGPEDEYQDEVDDDGRLAELPESKKNAIRGFDDAQRRGNALIEEMFTTDRPAKPKQRKPAPKASDEVEA